MSPVLSKFVQRAVIDSGGCGWREREAHSTYTAGPQAAPTCLTPARCASRWCWPSTASGHPVTRPDPEPPSDQPLSNRTQCGQVLLSARIRVDLVGPAKQPAPVWMVTFAAHRDRPRETALRWRVWPGTSAYIRHQLLARVAECGIEVAYVPTPRGAASALRFFLTNDLRQRGGAERGNSCPLARPCCLDR